MTDPDLHASKRALAATELVELVGRGGPPHPTQLEHIGQMGARFHLRLYDAGLDLEDPDVAASVCAVVGALLDLSVHDPACGLSIAARTASASFTDAAPKAERS